jgi:hypothetical protein
VATLGRLDALEADVLVRGHGAIQHDRCYLRKVQGLLAELVREVRDAVAGGASLEETRRRVTLADRKVKFAGDDPTLERSFDRFFVQPAVERAWHQALGDRDTPVRGA